MQTADPFFFFAVGRFPRPKLENHILRRQLPSPEGDQGEVGSSGGGLWVVGAGGGGKAV